MLDNIRIAIRPSQLALKQAEEAINLLKQVKPSLTFAIKTIHTKGDKDKITPISQVEGSDFFTKEIDDALLSGDIDLAVHSSKDLPEVLPKGLIVAFETKTISPFDVLVSRKAYKFNQLPLGSKIGVSSLRRKEQIKAKRADLEIVDIRGNIEERLAFIDSGEIEALIVAHAALIRLGLENRISEILTSKDFSAHSKQGSLSLVARKNVCKKLKFILSALGQEIGN